MGRTTDTRPPTNSLCSGQRFPNATIQKDDKMKRSAILLTAWAASLVLASAGSAVAVQQITGAQVLDGTIQADDLAEDAIDPAYRYRTTQLAELGGTESDYDIVTVTCPTGTRAVNGGLRADNDGMADVELSYPTRRGWTLGVVNGSSQSGPITAFAVCI